MLKLLFRLSWGIGLFLSSVVCRLSMCDVDLWKLVILKICELIW